MTKLTALSGDKSRRRESHSNWDQVLDLDEPGLELGVAEREMFNCSFEYYAAESFQNAYHGVSQLAEKGSSVSQYFLGIMYLKGSGVLQDFIQAHMWFNIATSKDHKKARGYLDKLTDRMSPEQLAEAQKRAREWVDSRDDAFGP